MTAPSPPSHGLHSLNDLRAFVAVVETGSFSAAALR
ncbi:MAG: LysR family transcriptional regulator, partial [Geminicoccaceae bacterium]